MSRYSRLNQVLFVSLAITVSLFGQSTGGIQGTISDTTNSPIPNASIRIKAQSTGVERTVQTDTAGIYSAPSLPVGLYRVEVRSPGMAVMAVNGVDVPVGTTVRQDFTLKVSAASEVVEVQGGGTVLVDTTSVSVGSVVNQTTVQEIPLNGRHFVDLALLTPGTVTPPANGFLTAPLRGQGAFSFNSAGAREDSVNFMVNGINLSDPNQNQITFQPTINTVAETKIDNFSFSAEYGRNSGSIVNIASRSGENAWHGEAYEFLRNNDLDARNFSNPTNIISGGNLVPNPMAPFKRNQFGGDGGGALKKDKLFMFLTYEEERQRQGVPISTTTLTAAQIAQAQATSDSIVKSLLPLIPGPNSGTNQYVASAVAPVNIYAGTANVSYVFSDKNRFNFYYAIQRDERNEPPGTDGNSFPGGGDQRNGKRQLMTLNDSWAISPTMVNEIRLGFNRIHITFVADNMLSPTAYGIASGATAAIGIPQITVSGAFTFGGISGFPQGRGDNTYGLSDTLSWIHGNHSIKIGGEFRPANSDNFSYTPGTFTFPSITAFLADQASNFTANPGNGSNRTYSDSLGFFVTDSWKVTPTFTAQLGIRYDWYGTPHEAENRFVVFDPATDTLQHVGQGSGPSSAYNQSAKNFEPRIGYAWDPFRNGKTVIRSAFAIMTDQPILGLVTPLAANPPYAFPVSFAASAAVPYVTLGNAFPLAGGIVSPGSVAHNYRDAYATEWNFNIQQQLGNNYGLMIGYFGTKGTDLNIERNYNQPINGVKPYATLSANSPIDPGLPLGNILVYESDGNSTYHGMWLKMTKEFSKGLTFNVAYTFSKSIDENSRNHQGLVVQNSYNISGDRGLSDFDVRNRIVISGVYQVPFKGNRFKEGWEMSLVEQSQTGSPINFHTNNTTLTGLSNTVRPYVTGPVQTGYLPGTSATSVAWVDNPGVFLAPTAIFGNLGRNVVIGPGFSNLDFALVKNTKLAEHVNWQVRIDAFDLLNQTNFYNPNLTLSGAVPTIGANSSTFGLITAGTRFPAGDGGTSRQFQLAMKLQF